MGTKRGGKIRLSTYQLRWLIFAIGFAIILLQFFNMATFPYYFYAAVAMIIVSNYLLMIPSLKAFLDRASKPGGGGVLGAVKGSLSGGDASEELATSLRSMGIEAKVVEADGQDAVDHDVYVGGAFGNLPLKVIKVEGRNIDLVELYRAPSKHNFYYLQNYVIKANVRGLVRDLKATLMPVYQGVVSPRAVGYRWVDKGAGSFFGWQINWPMFIFGLIFMSLPLFALIQLLFPSGGMVINYGILPFAIPMILAFIAVGLAMSIGQWIAIRHRTFGTSSALVKALNGDPELTQMILRAFRDARIWVAAHQEYNYVGISGGDARRRSGIGFTVGGQSVINPDAANLGLKDFPSREAFEVFDRIAGHVRRIAPAAPDEPGEELAQAIPGMHSPLPMRGSFKRLGLLGRMGGGLVLIGFAIAWLAIAYYVSGSDWQNLLPALPVVGIFVAIGAIVCMIGYRNWARARKRIQRGPVSDR